MSESIAEMLTRTMRESNLVADRFKCDGLTVYANGSMTVELEEGFSWSISSEEVHYNGRLVAWNQK